MVRRPPLRSPALALLLAAGLPGQQPHRIGVFFWHDSPNDRATFEGIRRGFADAGARCDFVVREADSDADRAAVALRELREGGCELVFAMGTQAALLAERAITDRPVVFAAVSNPVASGVVPSWESSGRDNVCGATNWIAPQNVLEVFRLAVPGIARLGMLRSADAGVVSQAELATMRSWLEHTAHPRIEVIESVARDADDVERAAESLAAAEIDAIWIPIDITIYRNVDAVRRAVGVHRLPLLTTAAAGVEHGAMVGAIPDYPLHGRRAAMLAVDVLLHGKRPRDLPIDRMAGGLVIANLDAADRLGIEFPLSLLVLADRLIQEGGR